MASIIKRKINYSVVYNYVGAAGVISVIGNALPKAFSRMIRLEFRGEYEPARKLRR